MSGKKTLKLFSTDLGYTGQEKVSNLPIMYYNARWYDPTLGRFLQPDSIIPEPFNPVSLDRYAYVNNNPIMNNDPSGHCIGPLAVVCLAVFAITTAVTVAGPAIVASLPMMTYWDSYTPQNEVDVAVTQTIPLLLTGGALAIEGVRALPAVENSAQNIAFVGKPEGVNAPVTKDGRAFVQGVANNSRVLTPAWAQDLASAENLDDFRGILGNGWNEKNPMKGPGINFSKGAEEVRLMEKRSVDPANFVFRWSTKVSEEDALNSGLKIHEFNPARFVEPHESGWVQQIPNGGGYALNWSLGGNVSWITPPDNLFWLNHIATNIPIPK